MNESKNHQTLLRLCAAAALTAIVFVGNYLRVTIPVSLGGVTSFTLANILCALSGILLGPWWGFLSAGLGSAFFDMTNPAYVDEALITFFTKGMYGFVSGLVLHYLFRKSKDKYVPQAVSAASAAVTYMLLYLVKTYFYNGMVKQGFTEPLQCWTLVVSKIPATLFNGGIAIICAPVLGVALMKAMRSAHLEKMLA